VILAEVLAENPAAPHSGDDAPSEHAPGRETSEAERAFA
jgi:hypothetical protein